MKWILIFLVFSSQKLWSQQDLNGDWYSISIGRLLHFKIDKNTINWDERTFSFNIKEGKEHSKDIVRTVYHKDLTCFIHNEKDAGQDFVSMTVLRYNKNSIALDFLMECDYDSNDDSLRIREFLNSCYTSETMVMRFYSKATIDSLGKLKPVTQVPANELKKINGRFEKRRKELVKEFGEDKLLWIAPIIFQRVLVELLIEYGYNPMITEKQATELFDFIFY